MRRLQIGFDFQTLFEGLQRAFRHAGVQHANPPSESGFQPLGIYVQRSLKRVGGILKALHLFQADALIVAGRLVLRIRLSGFRVALGRIVEKLKLELDVPHGRVQLG